MHNRVSGQPALDETHPGGGAGAIMRLVFRPFWRPPLVDVGNGNSSNDRTGRHVLDVPGTALYTKVRYTPHFSPGGWRTARRCVHYCPRISQTMITTTQTSEALHAGMRQNGKALDMLSWQIHHDTTRRHQICSYPYTCTVLLLAHCLWRMIFPGAIFLEGNLDKSQIQFTSETLVSVECFHKSPISICGQQMFLSNI